MKKKVTNPIDNRKEIINPALGDEVEIESRAKSALKMMKSLEAERKSKMVECRIDSRTVICATPELIVEMKEKLNKI